MIFLNLDRPIVFFDLETTGVSTEYDRIVQMAFVKIFPDGKIVKKSKLINPTIPIPEGATNVHGISDEMVENELRFKQMANTIFNIFDGCDVGGFNSRRFDLPLLRNEFKRCGIDYDYLQYKDIDVFVFEKYVRKELGITTKYESKLSQLYKYYLGKSLDGAHDALIDVVGTIEVFNEQLKALLRPNLNKIVDLIPNNGEYLTNSKILEKDGEYVWNFGKHKGKSITSNWSYGKWFYNTETFSINERKIVGEKLNII